MRVKAELARKAGCDDIVYYRKEDVATRVRAITQGHGVDVVYDAVGKDTYLGSLDSLAKLGLFVSYGQASGPLPLIDSQELAKRGSLFLTRPSLAHYAEDAVLYQHAAQDLLALVAKGVLTPHIGQRFPLAETAKAHEALEAGKTEGSTVLTT